MLPAFRSTVALTYACDSSALYSISNSYGDSSALTYIYSYCRPNLHYSAYSLAKRYAYRAKCFSFSNPSLDALELGDTCSNRHSSGATVAFAHASCAWSHTFSQTHDAGCSHTAS